MGRIAAGLADPVHDAQMQFRDLLWAMSRPGSVVVLRGGLPAPPEPLVPAAYALLLGLVDGDSPVWLDGDYPDASQSIRFHIGARTVAEPGQAAFAVVTRASSLLPLERFAQGSHDYPDRSCTVILQVDHLAAGAGLKLRGPGIAGTARLEIGGVPEGFVPGLQANRRRFPLGVDLVLAAGRSVACLPRSTDVEA
ncbi:MAG TPA: phosphonate C-P lyase system protein PhnH [Geminicoccus sp.]|uniref:phosphonate C-P lyase system protein PhnH n=1 Tax=Geminicoccus sp. TaxID=2024832 RepID=UPI002C029D46|nr:phosphonate C-P lyase system protein PhnH [Geminicoccus sp.]HWL70812.1 phosphonate C-P lyase system protein PhnH [Geminicoccus sp.]